MFPVLSGGRETRAQEHFTLQGCWRSARCAIRSDLQSQGVDLQSQGVDLQSKGVDLQPQGTDHFTLQGCWRSARCAIRSDLQSQGMDLQSKGVDLQSQGVVYTHRAWPYMVKCVVDMRQLIELL
jgi:hypothetical protein